MLLSHECHMSSTAGFSIPVRQPGTGQKSCCPCLVPALGPRVRWFLLGGLVVGSSVGHRKKKRVEKPDYIQTAGSFAIEGGKKKGKKKKEKQIRLEIMPSR